MWGAHLGLESRAARMILDHDNHFAAVMNAFERDRLNIAQQLESISLSAWPRSPESGLNSMRLRVTETLILMLHQIERERIAVLPLLRRSSSRVAGPVIRQLHSVVFSTASAG